MRASGDISRGVDYPFGQDRLVRVPVGDTLFSHVRTGSFTISPSQNTVQPHVYMGRLGLTPPLGRNTTTTRSPVWQRTGEDTVAVWSSVVWSAWLLCDLPCKSYCCTMCEHPFIETGCYVIIRIIETGCCVIIQPLGILGCCVIILMLRESNPWVGRSGVVWISKVIPFGYGISLGLSRH
jgi:hypothetical protein